MRALLGLALMLFWGVPASAATDTIYSRAELDAEAVRLRNAVIKIYEIGIKPSLTAEEKRALGAFEFSFPFPKPGDDLLNFAATTDGRLLIMPVMSLKMLEDLTTAYAWRYYKRDSLGAIDLYFAMLRYRDERDFPGAQYPPILQALGVPKDANEQATKVDEMSLSLRNEAFAFIIVHELGHIRFKHKPTDQISARQSTADELEADQFALDVLARTKTPALGASLIFQAQIYSLLHRHEFPSRKAWQDYVSNAMTHPMSVDRIRAMADFMRGPLARSRPAEAHLWRDIGLALREKSETLDDEDIARCIVRAAKQADLAILAPQGNKEGAELTLGCWDAIK
jgi:hypothetical protein